MNMIETFYICVNTGEAIAKVKGSTAGEAKTNILESFLFYLQVKSVLCWADC